MENSQNYSENSQNYTDSECDSDYCSQEPLINIKEEPIAFDEIDHHTIENNDVMQQTNLNQNDLLIESDLPSITLEILQPVITHISVEPIITANNYKQCYCGK